MNVTERLELLMQRAADGELSVEQRHELMELVEYQPRAWKRLACTFLEAQLVGQHIRQAPRVSPDPEESEVQPVRRSTGFWFHHPTLTTAITICLAFAVGLTVPWDRDSGSLQPMPSPMTANLEGTISVDTDSQGHNGSIDEELRREIEELQRMLQRFH